MDRSFFGVLPPRPKLAIISSYDEFCGIAGFTRALEMQLRPYADLQVFDLDQYLLRSPHKRVRRLADQHIQEIAAQLSSFDSVNIQLEHGTLGKSPRDIIRRFKWLAEAAPRLSITFHTVMVREAFPLDVISRLFWTGQVSSAFRVIDMTIRENLFSTGIYSFLRNLQHRKQVSLIVHAKRDMRSLQDVYRLKDIYHHPLSFIAPERAERLRAGVSRNQFPLLANLPSDAKLIGTFGFLSPYKGFETVIQALRGLAETYHLLVFGGIHPQGIKREQPLDPYIRELLKAGRIGQTVLDQLREAKVETSPSSILELVREHPQSLRSRVHFMGALPDKDFFSAMAICDAVVLPYLEVGQNSSGPISVALEMGARVIASRTHAFMNFGKYHPGLIEYFDIGNYAELADRLVARPATAPGVKRLVYNTDTNVAMYMAANGFPAPQQDAAGAAIMVETVE
jgi:glycosyltransferase involved in cell wall biosynthesis